jgi:hypothetical protein
MYSNDEPPVRKSSAPPGEVADEPESIHAIEVSNDEEAIGFLISWDTGEWLYAESDDHVSLDERI